MTDPTGGPEPYLPPSVPNQFKAAAPPREFSAAGRRPPPTELYPESVVSLDEARGISPSTGAAIVFALLVVVLLVLMGTGYNQEVPFLHPPAAGSITIAGDRLVFSYVFVSNGTWANQTSAHLCPECPFAVDRGAMFSYSIEIDNPWNQSVEMTSVIAQSPFGPVTYTPQNAFIAGGLGETISLSVAAPTTDGIYVLPLTVVLDVS